MINYSTSFNTGLEVLRSEDFSSEYGAATVRHLAEKGMVVLNGVTEHLAKLVTATAAEPHIKEYCPKDDSTSRFATKESFAEWLKKGGGRGMTLIAAIKGHEGPLRIADVATITEEDLDLRVYGWSGLEKNKHIIGADITTAYRVAESGLHQGLGNAITRLVTASAVDIHGVEDPSMISLEAWKSNAVAVGMYDRAGYKPVPGVEAEPEPRPTLKRIGELVAGNAVYVGEKDGKQVNLVEDTRLFRRFDPSYLQ